MPDDTCDHEWGDPEKVYDIKKVCDIDADGVRHLVNVLIRKCALCGQHDVQWLREIANA